MSGYRGVLVGCLVPLLLAAGVVGTAAAQSQVTLTVTVVDQNGSTVSNVDISATWEGGGGPVNETTRASGQALIDVPRGANVSLRVHDDRYVRNVPYVVTDASTRAVEVPVSRAATATVTVVDADGQPTENAQVRLYRDGNYVVDTRTGADGTVTTKRVEEGTYSVIATKPGFYRNLTRVQVSGETRTTVRIEEGSVLMTVSVVDRHFEDPKPIRDATVRLESPAGFSGTVPTLSDGTASFTVPVNDRYELTITKDGYETVEKRVAVGESDTSVDTAIRRTPEIDLRADNERVVVGETVRLRVRDEYGDPVANATISRGEEEVGTTDADGELTASVTSAGNVTFTATTADLTATTTVIGVDPGEDGTASPTPTATPTPATEPPTTAADGPGFTVGIAVVALLVVAVLALRRR